MLVLFLVIFSLCLNFSKQDLVYELALKQGLNFTEAGDVFEYGTHGLKRQATFKTKTGIAQTKICGINGKTSSRLRRQENPDDRPQGSEDWPWMALFLYKSDQSWFCGGSLLNSRYVLTAAHCFAKGKAKDKDTFFVRLGEFNIHGEEETEIQNFEVEELIVHRDYDAADQKNDIAILKLNQTVEYTRFVRPICLSSVEPRPRETTFVAGWGRTDYDDQNSKSHLLLYVDVPVLDIEQCRDDHTALVHDTNICAAVDGGKDSCIGDSGGPLMYQGNSKRWEIVGVVSWGKGCAMQYPGVYTSVPKFLRWIGERITDASP